MMIFPVLEMFGSTIALAHGMIEHCLEATDIVLIDELTLVDVELFVAGCEVCAENAAMSLEYVLDALTDSDPTVTEYLMCRPARCPSCSSQITEKSLVAV